MWSVRLTIRLTHKIYLQMMCGLWQYWAELYCYKCGAIISYLLVMEWKIVDYSAILIMARKIMPSILLIRLLD